MNFSLNNTTIYNLFIKWKQVVIIVAISSAIISAIFSSPYFIKPKFKSSAIVYPNSLTPFSQESPTEQLLQLFKSEDIRNNIIKEFDLIKHYKIDTTRKYFKSELYQSYESKIFIDKTEYQSVAVTVFDTDPEIASKIASSIIFNVNQKIKQLQKQKAKETFTIVDIRYNNKLHQVDSLKTLLDSIRLNFQIIDYTIQLKEASRQYFNLAQKSTPAESNYLSKFMKNMQLKGGELYLINESYGSAVFELQKIQIERENALSELQKELTYTSVVTKPFPADKQTYPVRWLIVLTSVISSLVITLLVIAFIEKIKTIDAE